MEKSNQLFNITILLKWLLEVPLPNNLISVYKVQVIDLSSKLLQQRAWERLIPLFPYIFHLRPRYSNRIFSPSNTFKRPPIRRIPKFTCHTSYSSSHHKLGRNMKKDQLQSLLSHSKELMLLS